LDKARRRSMDRITFMALSAVIGIGIGVLVGL
jgi:hypothetical protein